ncbi:MAG TPA: TRAM domain-containing protein [Actinomycetota bacterium]|nr:TRAM domain-containing protein [Actinomycetota bacterium]
MLLTPTTMASTGEAIARDPSGRVVFVPGALPGEEVLAEIEAERPKSATARLVSVGTPSPDRVAPPCPEVARGCGGCGWQHIRLEAQRRHKEEIVAAALRFASVDPPDFPPTVALEPWGFRTSVRAAVTGGRAGFHAARSHDMVAVAGCMVLHPLLAPLLTGCRYPGADAVLLRCGASTGERMAATTPAGRGAGLPADVHPGWVHEDVAGRRWRVSAGSFFQSRPDGAEALVRLVTDGAGGDPGTALDLYSGVGLFAGVLAERGWSVTAVESTASAVRDARHNLKGSRAQVVRADATRWAPPVADLVVADPPRVGLGRRGVAVVAASAAGRLVLVSCDAVSLGRDAALLAREGFRLASVQLVDLFPQTAHVEVVSVFERA